MIDNKLLNSVLKKIDIYLSEKILDNEKPDFDKNVAFLLDGNKLIPVKKPKYIDINSLIGIERAKNLILNNTEKFVNGRPANNVLLWGERGTGKSSLVKALIPIFSDRGLRLIHVQKKDIFQLWFLYDLLEEFDNYRFILFLDDFSFEENQVEYKELKTVIDGGIKGVPDNLLFYVTSNRKNLIPVKFSDRNTDDTRFADTLEEKLSLVDRFGLRIGFFKMSQKTYLEIVDFYASLFGISMDKEKLHRLAIQFADENGVRNGRVALQFIKSL